MTLLEYVYTYNQKRNNELIMLGFIMSNVNNEQEAIQILSKYIDNDDVISVQDLQALNIISDTPMWDI